ncbi:hypothetical protein KIN20_019422 [Parelaphostrongylus tenuis]|uniref:Serine/threonine-protein phosphatase n=1 Tax=Parelaphostrongylus tenuis TaxID=148309 RepID=A0AAD5N4U5_PARTN|nr:hypothetical protein KIN20_019422 [Parelaphostrongylus tenuis]
MANPTSKYQAIATPTTRQQVQGGVDYSAFLKRHLKMSNVLNNRRIRYTSEELQDVQRCSIELFKMESTLAKINPPIVIVGDIHGQYIDLLRMFSKFSEGNQHGSMRVKYIFLGDYVDRGRRSLECICLVLTLKILFPRKYQLLRGNHECKGINRVYGFYDELLDRFEKSRIEQHLKFKDLADTALKLFFGSGNDDCPKKSLFTLQSDDAYWH